MNDAMRLGNSSTSLIKLGRSISILRVNLFGMPNLS